MLDEVIGVGESHAPGGGVRVHSSGRAKPGAGLGGVARGERQRNSGIFRWRKRVGGAGGKVPIPHALHPFLSTSDVDRRVTEKIGLNGLEGPSH